MINGAVTGGGAETFRFSSSERTSSFWSLERQMEVMSARSDAGDCRLIQFAASASAMKSICKGACSSAGRGADTSRCRRVWVYGESISVAVRGADRVACLSPRRSASRTK